MRRPMTIATLIALLVGILRAADASEIGGPVSHVRDGDTLVVAGTAIRLQGLDAPELREPGGADAARLLRSLVAGRRLRCTLDGTRSFDRRVGICSTDGQDLAALLVAAGVARDCPRYSGGRYAPLETAAARMLPRHRYCLPRP